MLLSLWFRFPFVLPACAGAIYLGQYQSSRRAKASGHRWWSEFDIRDPGIPGHGNVQSQGLWSTSEGFGSPPASAAFGVAIFGRAFGGLRGLWLGRLGPGLSALCGRIGLGA